MPQSHKDIVFPTQKVAQFVERIVTNRLQFPVTGKNGLLILCPNGMGKTTLARLLPSAMETHRSGNSAIYVICNNIAVDENGVTLIGAISNTSQYVPIDAGRHYFISYSYRMSSGKSLRRFRPKGRQGCHFFSSTVVPCELQVSHRKTSMACHWN